MYIYHNKNQGIPKAGLITTRFNDKGPTWARIAILALLLNKVKPRQGIKWQNITEDMMSHTIGVDMMSYSIFKSIFFLNLNYIA